MVCDLIRKIALNFYKNVCLIFRKNEDARAELTRFLFPGFHPLPVLNVGVRVFL